MDSGEDKLTDDESSSPSKSRFGRTRKPKISEDFICYINGSYSSLKVDTKSVQRRSKSPQKLNKPQSEDESNLLHEIDLFTNAPKQIIPLKEEPIPPPVYMKVLSPELNLMNRKFFKSPKNKESIEEPDIDVNKVMKIVGSKTESETIADIKTYTKPVLKTYCNKRKSMSKPIVESFGLPDMTIIPEPENRITIPKRIQELDVEISSDDVTIDDKHSLFPWESDNATGVEDMLSTFNEDGTNNLNSVHKLFSDINEITEPNKQKCPQKYKKQNTNNPLKDEVKDSVKDVCFDSTINIATKKKKKSVKPSKGKGVPKYKTKSMKKYYNFLGKQRRNEKVLRLVKKLKIDMNVNSDPVPQRLRKESNNVELNKTKNKLKSKKKTEKKVIISPKLKKLKNPEAVKTHKKNICSPKLTSIGSENVLTETGTLIASSEKTVKSLEKTPKKSNTFKFTNKLSAKRTRSMSPVKVVKTSPSVSLKSQKQNVKNFKSPRSRKYLNTSETKEDLENLNFDLENVTSNDVNLLSNLKNVTQHNMRCSVRLKRCDDIVVSDIITLGNKKAENNLRKTQNVETNSTNSLIHLFEEDILSTTTDTESANFTLDELVPQQRINQNKAKSKKHHTNKRRSNRLQNGVDLAKIIPENKNIFIDPEIAEKALINVTDFNGQEVESSILKHVLSDKKIDESQKFFKNNEKTVCSPKIKNRLIDKKKNKGIKEDILRIATLNEDFSGKYEIGMASNLVILSDCKEFEMSENGNMQNCSITKHDESYTIFNNNQMDLTSVLDPNENARIISPIKDNLSKDIVLSEIELENAMINTYLENALSKNKSFVNEIIEEKIVEQETEEIERYLKNAEMKKKMQSNVSESKSNCDLQNKNEICSTNNYRLDIETNNNKNEDENKSCEKTNSLRDHSNEISTFQDIKKSNIIPAVKNDDVNHINLTDTTLNEDICFKPPSDLELIDNNVLNSIKSIKTIAESQNSKEINKYLKSEGTAAVIDSETSKEINKENCLISSDEMVNVESVVLKSNEVKIGKLETVFNVSENTTTIELGRNENVINSIPKKNVETESLETPRQTNITRKSIRKDDFKTTSCKKYEILIDSSKKSLENISIENEVNKNVSALITNNIVDTESPKISSDIPINSTVRDHNQVDSQLCTKFMKPNNSVNEKYGEDKNVENLLCEETSLIDNSNKTHEEKIDKLNLKDSQDSTETINCKSRLLSLEEIENITFDSCKKEKKGIFKRKTKQNPNKNLPQKHIQTDTSVLDESPSKRKSVIIDEDLSIQETQIEEIIIESSDDELSLHHLQQKLKNKDKKKALKENNSSQISKSKKIGHTNKNDLRKSRKRKFGIEELGNIDDDVEFIKRATQDSPMELKKDESEKRKGKNRKMSKSNEIECPTVDENKDQKEIKMEKLEFLSSLEQEDYEDVGKMLEDTRLGTYNFKDGDLAYARLGKCPFWPCMIVLDPSSKTFLKKCPGKAMIVTFYHVRFFGDKGRRSWVRCHNVMPLKGPNDFKRCIDYLKDKGEKYCSLQPYQIPTMSKLKWKQGFMEATSLVKSSRKERYAFFDDLFERMKTVKREILDQTAELTKASVVKEEKKVSSISEIKESLSPKKSKFKNEDISQVYSLRVRQRKNSESSKNKEDAVKTENSQKELNESIKNKSQLEISSDSSYSDTESSSKWSIKVPLEMTHEDQIALHKRNNLFKGVPRERVCQICYNPGEILKCKGKCFGYYHKSCALTNPIKKAEKVIGEKITNEITGSEVEVVLVKNKNYQEPARLSLNNDSIFKTLSLGEQIDMKLKEVMSPIVDKTVYADSTTDYTSSEESASEKSNDTSEVIEHVTGDDIIVVAKPVKKRKITKDSDDFKCTKCQQNKESVCHVCGNEISPKGSDVRQRCSNTACGKFFHRECLKVWPQTQFSILKNKESELNSFCCPMHVCHICVSDDPRQTISRLSSDKVVKCLKCPATYHSNTHCIPAGTDILTTTQIICPRHLSYDKPAKANKHTTKNTTWCFICSLGGDLICCETCPTSVHAECSSINLMDDDTFICEDCETGRLPLYDEIVWVKLGSYRWWPALTLFPNDVPNRVMSVPHLKGEFVVRFFGTHDHYWVGRGLAFLFQEGDAGPQKSVRKRVEWVFQQAIEEAANAFAFKNNFKKNRENTLRNDMKPPPYIKIKVNKPVGNVKLFDGNISNTAACNCDPKSPGPCGADSYCLNRLLLTECDPEVCPAGDKCENQRFEKREYPPLEPYKTDARGWGLKTLKPIKKGQFVIEYVGEIIDDEEYQRRILKMHEQKEDNYYFLTIDKDRMIDAGPKGNVARFMNHCCQPNCETQKWTVKGDTRVGLFASQDIPGDTELTFNYNLECAGEEKKVCKCGAPTCSGFIGLKAKNIDDKKIKRKVKKKRSPTPTVINEEPCFVCGKSEDTFGCQNKICTKFYHLKCVNLEVQPDSKWSCPWHNCNLCTKRTIRCCVKCTNSFCPVHSEGNVRYDKLLGFICTEHDPSNEPQERINEIRKISRTSPRITEESDVTSTTIDIESQEQKSYKSEELVHSEIMLKKTFVTGKKRNRSTRNSLTSRKRIKLDGTLVDNTVNIVNNVTAQKELLLTSSSKDPKYKSVQEN